MRLNNNNEKLAYKQIVGLPEIEQKKTFTFWCWEFFFAKKNNQL